MDSGNLCIFRVKKSIHIHLSGQLRRVTLDYGGSAITTSVPKMATTSGRKRALFTIESIVGKSPSPPPPPSSPLVLQGPNPTSVSKLDTPTTLQEMSVFAGTNQHKGFYPLPPYDDALLAAALLSPYIRSRETFPLQSGAQSVLGLPALPLGVRTTLESAVAGPGSQRTLFRWLDGGAVVKDLVWRASSPTELMPWQSPFLTRHAAAINGPRITGQSVGL